MRHLAVVVVLVGAASAETLDQQVNDAIEAGVSWLKGAQRRGGGFRTAYSESLPGGPAALAVYALAKSGVDRDDPSIVAALASIRADPPRHVYSVATLILALDALHDPAHDDWIRDLARWLEKCRVDKAGLWNYGPKPPHGQNEADLSNTQFAALGLWAAERHGYRAARGVWRDLVRRVPAYQDGAGAFRYRPEYGGWGGMTAAGITLLTLGLERVPASERTRREAEESLAKGWEFLAREFTVETNPVPGGAGKDAEPYQHYYYLYGLERICALAKRERIGDRDWYEEGARYLVAAQDPDGSWHGDAIDTCWALLFLRRATFTAAHGGPPPELSPKAKPVEIPVKPAGDRAFHVRRWLTLGPFPDPEAKRLDEALIDEAAAPRAGMAEGALRWRGVSQHGSWFRTGSAEPAGGRIAYAFTYLHVSRPTRAVLWLEHGDASCVFLDGKQVYRGDGSREGAVPIEADLDPGAHRLLLKLRSRDAGLPFRVCVTTRGGGFARAVAPSLEQDARSDRNLRHHPELSSLQELLDRLPADGKAALEFDSRGDVGRAVWLWVEGGSVQWQEEGEAFWWGRRPPPGRRGLALVASAGEGGRGQVLRKVLVPGNAEFRVTAAPEIALSKGKGDCRLRLGVFDGRMTWLADGAIEGARWTTLRGDLAPFAGRTVLLVVECGTEGDRFYDLAFLDEASVVPKE